MGHGSLMIADENRGFKEEWTESFAFIANAEGLPACLLCNEKLSNNKKSNLERHFQGRHAKFAANYPFGSERKSAITVLLEKLEERKGRFKKWIASPNSTTAASFVATREIIKYGKPFMDGDYMKDSVIKISAPIFRLQKQNRDNPENLRHASLRKDGERKGH